jgi:hypothetical protein
MGVKLGYNSSDRTYNPNIYHVTSYRVQHLIRKGEDNENGHLHGSKYFLQALCAYH